MNIRLKSLFSVGLLGLLCLMLPKAARADDFTFSFTGPLGTVTGEIFGLTNNTTGPATGLTFTSFPVDFVVDPAMVSPVTDLFTSGHWLIISNQFTEVGGTLLLHSFLAQSTTSFGGTRFEINNGFPGASLSNSTFFLNNPGVPVFSPVAVPEPSSFSLMLIGLMALGTLVAVSTQKTGQALES